MKTCSRCKTERQNTEFNPSKTSSDGLNAWCKPCRAIYQKQRIEANPEYYKQKDREYRLKYKDKSRERSHIYYLNNRQKAIAYAMHWQRSHRDRSRKTLRDCSYRLWLNTLHLLGDQCACCCEKRLSMLNVDHIYNDGASHRKRVGGARQTYREILVMENPKSRFQVLCSNCNLSKVRNKGACEHLTNKEPKTLFEAEGRFDRFKRRFDASLPQPEQMPLA